ncbi:methylenetetrahydrofolate reductase [NAD(P)H] [Notoacmeibacter sp. MSK16QG-6]|uniref:methylenetetrahydrofolate reductase [NAD(P)H] n=1 Tax=Notoacmeibacter sp. MSK16QG-6 TaxID=2957982 RepID=UPI0020A01ECC|nr:methylenetetrahydrofolate reductase [NAD(P)H] [Notoacmeibacter sp. MSK16QG-6]MCP1200218.1 methylenetetrahydrofolate reductase [NAD(P)H] [Notoacmeibacter sp. MSK16QG-6]
MASPQLPLRDVDRQPAAIRLDGANEAHVKVSYEFFPPKTEKAEADLWYAVKRLEMLQPSYVSVTYGAGGSTQERTLGTVARMVRETSLTPAAHLTCVGASCNDIDDVADRLWDAGIRSIVALRGDSPSGFGGRYEPHPEGYSYAPDLIAGLRKRHDFEIFCSAYPERHPESADWQTELDVLRRKADAGATKAITQFFFEADTFFRFRDRVADAGIDIGIVPGVMLQPNIAGLSRMAGAVGVDVPGWYGRLFEGLEDDLLTRQMLTASVATDLCAELYDGGVRDFHLYTLNRADIAIAVSRALGEAHARIRQRD